MKRLIIFITLIIILSSISFAQKEKDIFLSIGINYWPSKWEGKNFTSSGIGLFGLKTGIIYNKFGLGLVYLRGDYKLDLKGSKKDADSTRQDFDFLILYQLIPKLSVTVGYKFLTYNYTHPSSDVTKTFHGPGIGLSFYAPIGESNFSIYASTSYLPILKMKDEFKIPGSSKQINNYNVYGYNFELGFSYDFENFPLSIDLGFRYQKISKSDINLSDKFLGAILDISYTFSI